jgi:hypothetical protein
VRNVKGIPVTGSGTIFFSEGNLVPICENRFNGKIAREIRKIVKQLLIIIVDRVL